MRGELSSAGQRNQLEAWWRCRWSNGTLLSRRTSTTTILAADDMAFDVLLINATPFPHTSAVDDRWEIRAAVRVTSRLAPSNGLNSAAIGSMRSRRVIQTPGGCDSRSTVSSSHDHHVYACCTVYSDRDRAHPEGQSAGALLAYGPALLRR